MNTETETNFGWWTDKPERASRMAALDTRSSLHAPRVERSVWKDAALIVALMLAVCVSVIRLV